LEKNKSIFTGLLELGLFATKASRARDEYCSGLSPVWLILALLLKEVAKK